MIDKSPLHPRHCNFTKLETPSNKICIPRGGADTYVGDVKGLRRASSLSCPPAPGTPSFLAFSEVTSTTLNVSWGEPTAANGVLQGYRVVYEPLAPVQGKPPGCVAPTVYPAQRREGRVNRLSASGVPHGPLRRAPDPASLSPKTRLSCCAWDLSARPTLGATSRSHVGNGARTLPSGAPLGPPSFFRSLGEVFVCFLCRGRGWAGFGPHLAGCFPTRD